MKMLSNAMDKFSYIKFFILKLLSLRKICVKTFVLGLLSLSLNAIAQPLAEETAQMKSPVAEQTVPQEMAEPVIARLKKARPELSFTDLKLSPINGLYEIKVNGQKAFVSQEGRYLIAGEMYEIRPNGLVNLQEQERQKAELAFQPQRAKILNALDTEDMVIYSPQKDAKGFVYVFTDIDCGFCRKLHSQMSDYLAKGIEIRYLAFPRAGVDSHSGQKLATTWCSGDRQSTMTDFKSGGNVALAPCDDNPVAEQYRLGQQVGVKGTPAIILESGKMIPGMVDPDRLASEMGI